MASFKIPQIDVNPEGWGPSTIPAQFKEVPYYAPYSKVDKLGKVADLSQQQQGRMNKFQKEREATATALFQSWSLQDDDTFQVVDNTKVQTGRRVFGKKGFQNRGYQQIRSMHQRGSQNFQQQQQQNRGNTQQGRTTGNRKNLSRSFMGNNFRGSRYDVNAGPNIRKREYSIDIKPEWKELEILEFNQLNKVSADEPKGEELLSCGSVEFYNKAYDIFSSRAEKTLEKTNRTFFNVTSSDDPIIRQLSMDGKGTVFGTDVILSHLMTCTRSVYPWDVIVQKVGSTIFFDKRDNSQLDFLTVNETAPEPPAEDGSINSPTPLSREATLINQAFSQQVLQHNEPPFKFDKANPFQTDSSQKVASVGYKYKRWHLSDDIDLVARCEIDGINKIEGRDVLLTIKAVNEYDPKASVDWRKKLETQRGAVITTELKNNSFKLAKWTVQSLLAGTDYIKLGYVSRNNPRDNTSHSVLAIQDFLPKEFSNQINLNLRNAWGIIKNLILFFQKQETGKYIILRDIERNSLRIYQVPNDSFDNLMEGGDRKEESFLGDDDEEMEARE